MKSNQSELNLVDNKGEWKAFSSIAHATSKSQLQGKYNKGNQQNSFDNNNSFTAVASFLQTKYPASGM
jgi:hypothetical protein